MAQAAVPGGAGSSKPAVFYHRPGGAGPTGPGRDGRRAGGHPVAPPDRQLERSRASTVVLRGAQFLAACLDEDGYLRDDVADLAQAAGLPVSILEEGLALLQTLDPPGVAARDLSQCLVLQLQRQGGDGASPAHCPEIFGAAGTETVPRHAPGAGVRQEEVLEAERKIQSLDPRPAPPFPAGRSPTI